MFAPAYSFQNIKFSHWVWRKLSLTFFRFQYNGVRVYLSLEYRVRKINDTICLPYVAFDRLWEFGSTSRQFPVTYLLDYSPILNREASCRSPVETERLNYSKCCTLCYNLMICYQPYKNDSKSSPWHDSQCTLGIRRPASTEQLWKTKKGTPSKQLISFM